MWLEFRWRCFTRWFIPLMAALGCSVTPSSTMAVDIMPLGDSITRGLNACSYRTPLVQALDSISSCSYTMVGTVSSPENPPSGACSTTNANHEGHGGFNTINYFQVIAPATIPRINVYLDANTPDVVLLHIGTNDMATSNPVGTYNSSTNQGTFTIGNIVNMIDEVYNTNSNAKIFVADLIPVTTDATFNTNISNLRSVITTMVADRASDGDDITLVPVSNGFTSAMMQSDGIHPNETGDAHIAGRFLAAMQSEGICASASPPPTVSKVSPSGITSTNTPTFQWQALPGISSYSLWVNDVTGVALQQTLTPAAASCSSGTGNCSFASPTGIYGNSSWWVRATNTSGNGSWGSAMTFSTPGGSVPGRVTLTSPTSGAAIASPQYRWSAQSSASNYFLWVNDASGPRIQQSYTASAVGCAGGTGTCQITPGVNLNSGTVDWWVQASNPAGTGAWSAKGSFYVGSTPPAATLLQPSGSGSGTNPTYSWNAVSSATYYRLWVGEGSVNIVDRWYTAAQAGCASGTGNCSINPPGISSGNRTWWIRTWNPAGLGPWSAGRNFN